MPGKRELREQNQPIPDPVLFPYPLPDVLGLRLDPDHGTQVTAVSEGSIADQAGIRAGDVLITLEGQPLASTADLQWVLHHAPTVGILTGHVMRDDRPITVTLHLDAQWRQRCDISWRVTTWDLRRMATGGLVLEDLSDAERNARDLPADSLALRVTHVGQYGDHAVGKRAGFAIDDVIVAAGDLSQRMSEGQFMRAVLLKPPGSRLPIQVLRGERTMQLELLLQ
jgi:S1-C subfamily serine protease